MNGSMNDLIHKIVFSDNTALADLHMLWHGRLSSWTNIAGSKGCGQRRPKWCILDLCSQVIWWPSGNICRWSLAWLLSTICRLYLHSWSLSGKKPYDTSFTIFSFPPWYAVHWVCLWGLSWRVPFSCKPAFAPNMVWIRKILNLRKACKNNIS